MRRGELEQQMAMANMLRQMMPPRGAPVPPMQGGGPPLGGGGEPTPTMNMGSTIRGGGLGPPIPETDLDEETKETIRKRLEEYPLF